MRRSRCCSRPTARPTFSLSLSGGSYDFFRSSLTASGPLYRNKVFYLVSVENYYRKGEVQFAPDGGRDTMNAFVIACGTYVAALGKPAITIARKLGRVQVDPGETACKVPDAESYILKSRRGAPMAPERKTVRC